ncbi:lipopolysaccharide biosynthesis protein [Allosphingosinicella indica]|uniref:Membrane protein involved in the export of O-antigen and teichoic acid n=1 Tax=Allosphingosinicella indica TaxID=941907 RepID=A0A1X7G2L2_9SPHN|nr:oligosaccharide flippase family protein [Allosphingosinicella indica]SMF62168.1 Membrane protein involved in the export of O-antigen and teichoic acid [Allosphingosinicella indica]
MDRKQYFRHFLILFSGTAAAQAANLVSYPFLARLYQPAGFGVFAMFVALSAIPGAIACLRFDLAVPIAPRHGRFAILWLCYTLSALVGILAAAGFMVFGRLATTEAGPVFSLLLGLCVFLTGFCAASSLYLMRHDAYKLNSVSLLIRTGATVLVQIGLAFVWRDPMALILGFTVGLVLQAATLGLAIARYIPPGRPHRRRMRAMFNRFRAQVAVDIPSTFIAAVSLNLMTFALLALYDDRVVGFYALASRIAIVPLQLFNDALGQVFFQKAARAFEATGRFWNEMKFNLAVSGALSVAVLLGMWLLARPFITLYLGKTWEPAADMLIILAPMLAIRSLVMSIGTTVFVVRRPQWLLLHNVANVAVLGMAYLLAYLGDLQPREFLVAAAWLLSLEYALFGIALILVAKRSAAPAAR